jgi:hypothetical protein
MKLVGFVRPDLLGCLDEEGEFTLLVLRYELVED